MIIIRMVVLKNKTMRSILILRFSSMGDVAIAASVMREVVAHNPKIHYIFATQAFFAPFFDNIPNLEIFPVDFNKKHKGVKGIFTLLKDLINNYKIDAVADLHDVLRSKILVFCFQLSLKKVKIFTINKGKNEKRKLCNIKNNNKKTLKPTWKRYVDVFQQLGLQTTQIQPKPIQFVQEKVKKIGISPFAQHKGKMYPPELMDKVLELLNNKYKIFLFGGGKKERDICEKWQEKYENVHSFVGKYSLKKELDVISTLDVVISMDSSGMHIASLCNIPCISIWGATHPFAGFVGFGQENNPQIQLELPCRPCSVYGNRPCKYNDYKCLYGIEPTRVVNGITNT